ncbi:AAA family ATPase [Streptomyces sp. SID8366]|uniref:AAA family ATPase n=1 Tax=unclassified Streptomyces TaxID=2593676 RepID=UPI000DBAC537|nr:MULTISPECIES: AAA family ATPase [unclassified Streptomyces]MYU09005.1 AAA family ATPase [Streptomyces sp. SID8366]MYU67973.1 AAA family ATPase [Streptomyces sp. SID69]RAJ52515.1 putative ATPase [Streptomyces sp. PsTaAH-130]
MELRRVTLENYRAFQKADWALPASGLILVSGANNSGKSSLLSALDVIAGTIGYEHGVGYQNARSFSAPCVTATFRLPEGPRSDILSRIRGIPSELLTAEEMFQEIQIVFGIRAGEGFSIFEIKASWPSSDPVCIARIASDKRHGHILQAIAPDQSGTTGGGVTLSDRWASSSYSPMEALRSQMRELAPIWEELELWRSNFYHFKALRGGSPRSASLASEPNLDPTGSNLPAVLLDLQTNRFQLMEELRELISQMVPDVGRLETPTVSNMLEVAFSDPFNHGFRHNLKELGTGVEQLLLTLVVGLTQQPPSVLVVEEPETNLHPAAQRALLGLFNSWASDRLIIAVTHSPVMLDWTPGGNQLWQVTRAEGASQLSTVEEAPLELLRSLGVRLSDVLSADRILVVEGPSDVDILSTWFPEVIRNPRVSVISGGGGDNARLADLFASWLSETDRIGARRVLYLRDRDELAPATMDKLSRSESVYVLDGREIENYLLEPEAITSVLSRQSPVKEVTTDTVKQAIHHSAEKLRPAMVVNRVARRIPNIRLMDHKTRGELASRGASEDEFWGIIESRFPNPTTMRATVKEYWDAAEHEVGEMSAAQLARWAPGEEILDDIFLHFLGRHFKKRRDGPELASSVGGPPEELVDVLHNFMSDLRGGEG